MTDSCVFCAIIAGQLPAYKLLETLHTVAFLDARPVSTGHLLVVPKRSFLLSHPTKRSLVLPAPPPAPKADHAAKLMGVPDDHLAELLPLVKRLAVAVGCEDFNVLQSNGALAMQTVGHVHFHMIPKTETEGLLMRLPDKYPQVDLERVHAEIKSKL